MVNPVLKRALHTWGEQAQMMMVVEEMSELMVAYSDERTIGDFLQNILVQHFVFQSYIVQDGLSKIRSLAADVPVIQIIDLIHRQHLLCFVESVEMLYAKD